MARGPNQFIQITQPMSGVEEVRECGKQAQPKGPENRSSPGVRDSSFRVAAFAFALVFSEWLFFVTKPSFLDGAPPLSRFAALWVASAPFLLLALALHGILCLMGWGLVRIALPGSRLMNRFARSLMAALILSAALLLLVDNFTYTVLSWGIVSTDGFMIAVYLGALLGAFLFILRGEMHASRLVPPFWQRRMARGWFVALLASTVWLAATEYESYDELTSIARSRDDRLPNIIVFSPDGLDANRTSAYGYERPTTPFLDRYLERAWFFSNAFSNSPKTGGSVTAQMTGRYPTTTKVFFPPHNLRGTDAYRHLPRLLRLLGYKNVQATLRYHVDGPDLNWKDSFHVANRRKLPDQLTRWVLAELVFDLPIHLGEQIDDRLSERIKHLVSIKRMVNIHQQVVLPDTPPRELMTDDERLDSVLQFIDEGHRPFFAQIHLLGTHCCKFRPGEPFFSKDMEDGPVKNQAAYDDTIREADRRFGRLMEFLTERDLLDDTLVVYNSDHSRGWGVHKRLPLLFFFPGQERVGEVHEPAQMMDLAPTILDYLGVEAPSWMEGTSLLRDLPPVRPIFAAAVVQRHRVVSKDLVWFGVASESGPPTYGLGKMGLIFCQRWHTLDLVTGEFEMGEVPDYSHPCPDEELLSSEDARARMEEHLLERGFGLPSVAEKQLDSPATAAETR